MSAPQPKRSLAADLTLLHDRQKLVFAKLAVAANFQLKYHNVLFLKDTLEKSPWLNVSFEKRQAFQIQVTLGTCKVPLCGEPLDLSWAFHCFIAGVGDFSAISFSRILLSARVSMEVKEVTVALSTRRAEVRFVRMKSIIPKLC